MANQMAVHISGSLANVANVLVPFATQTQESPRHFKSAYPLLWNSLPDPVRQASTLSTFRSRLFQVALILFSIEHN